MVQLFFLVQGILFALCFVLQTGLIGFDIRAISAFVLSYLVSSVVTFGVASRMAEGVARSLIYSANVIMCFVYSCLFLLAVQISSSILITVALALLIATLSVTVLVVMLMRL